MRVIRVMCVFECIVECIAMYVLMSGSVYLFLLRLFHNLPRHLTIQLEHGTQQHRLVKRQLDDIKHNENRDQETNHKASDVGVDFGGYRNKLCGIVIKESARIGWLIGSVVTTMYIVSWQG